MTENGQIFIVKNSILNLFAEKQISIGLSLYIIKDIKEELEQLYNKILQQQLLQESQKKQLSQNKNKKQQKKQIVQHQEEEPQIIYMAQSDSYPIEWIPGQINKEQNNQDQAD